VAELSQDRLEHRQHGAGLFGADHQVPQRLELLPPGGIGGVAKAGHHVSVCQGSPRNGTPAVEVVIGAPVSLFQLLAGHLRGGEDGVTRVVEVPIGRRDAALH